MSRTIRNTKKWGRTRRPIYELTVTDVEMLM
jgi:ribosomal protein S16